MGFSRSQLVRFEGTTVPDLIGPGCSLLFVGINPGLWTAATQTHFCHPSNRFYPALRRAGLIEIEVDPAIGMTGEERRRFTDAGLGITNLVAGATNRASEVDDAELKEGAVRLSALVSHLEPAVVAICGVTAFRTAFGVRRAAIGRQPSDLRGSELWVLPNPSGLNAHETIDSLAAWFRLVGQAAGVS